MAQGINSGNHFSMTSGVPIPVRKFPSVGDAERSSSVSQERISQWENKLRELEEEITEVRRISTSNGEDQLQKARSAALDFLMIVNKFSNKHVGERIIVPGASYILSNVCQDLEGFSYGIEKLEVDEKPKICFSKGKVKKEYYSIRRETKDIQKKLQSQQIFFNDMILHSLLDLEGLTGHLKELKGYYEQLVLLCRKLSMYMTMKYGLSGAQPYFTKVDTELSQARKQIEQHVGELFHKH